MDLHVKTHIKRVTIIEHLLKNKEKHIKHYEEAVKGYLDYLKKELENRLASVEAGNIERNYNLATTVPVNRVESYDKYIKLFSMNEEDIVELTVQDYDAIINDNWSWALQAFNINNFYSNG